MVRFRLLGRIDLRDGDGNEVRSVLAQPKRLALLAYLAAAGRDSTRRDTALGVFWPELSQERARTALNKAVHFLRQSLGNDVILSPSANEIVVSDARLWCDVTAFAAAVREKDFAAAMEHYGGDFLPGLYLEAEQPFEEWVDNERARLRRAAAQAARSLAEENEHAGRLTFAVNNARRAVELSETDERVVRELLELLDRLGDRAGALRAYDRFAARLAAEFDAEPSAETKALVERVRARAEAFASGAAGIQVPALGVEPASSGLHDRLQEALGAGYTLERELGGGGMARVFVVVEKALGRRVVLKVLNPDRVEGVSVARFRQEIQLAAQLAHPHIVPVLSAGVAAGLPYYTMPYVESESLRKKLEQTGALPIEEAVVVLRDVAKALVYAHAHNVVHRDIKPDNVLLAGGSAVVTDFGIAKAIAVSCVDATGAPKTQVGTSLGTPEYMAPEQAAGDPNTNQLADSYSFGVMAFELLAGRPPFHGMTPQALLAAHMNEKPRSIRELRPETPSSLTQLVMRCLEKQPEARPSSITILESLDRITNSAVPARQHALMAWPRRRRAAVLIGLSVAAFIVLQLGLRFRGIGPHASLLASGALAANEQLIVADFAARGNADTVLGPLAADAIRTDLVESKIVAVMPASLIRETLREMRRAPSSPVDLVTALEIAERRGTRAVIHGDITPLGAGFVATLRLVGTTSGDEIASFREVTETPNELIPALQRLSQLLRRRIGESLRDVRATPSLPQVTTGSLAALKKFKEGNTYYSRSAIKLLEEAVTIDSNFASAWRLLWSRYFNFGYPASVVDSAATRAFRARDHLKPLEAGLVEAVYYDQVLGDRAKTIAVYERLIKEYGTNGSQFNLVLYYLDRREFARAESLMQQAAAEWLTPETMVTYENWPLVLFNQEKFSTTDSVIRVGEPQPGYMRMTYMIATQRLDSALLVSMQLRGRDNPQAQTYGWSGQFVIDVTRGRVAAAMRALARARSTSAAGNAAALGLVDSIRAGEIDALLLERGARAVRRLDASVAHTPLRSLSDIDRPYFRLAAAYAMSRRPDRARAVLAEFDRDVRDTLVRRRVEHDLRWALGEIALAEGRPLEAVQLFRQADRRPDGPATHCSVCLHLRLARAFDAAQRHDSAAFYYERYLTTPFFPYYHEIMEMKAAPIGWVHHRLGQLYDGRGDRDRARMHYAKVADLWKDADQELQPKVADVRRRAAAFDG